LSFRVGDRVNLVFADNPIKDGAPYLLVNAQMNYVNEGAIGRDAIVTNEFLHIRVGDEPSFEYRWLHFETILPNPGDLAATTKDETVAHSFLVSGGGAESHQTTFAAFPDAPLFEEGADAYPLPLPFFQQLTREQPCVNLTLRSVASDGKIHSAHCWIKLGKIGRQLLANHGWATFFCNPSAECLA
jgi:hypothetical protein